MRARFYSENSAISFGHTLHFVCFNLYCGGFIFCNVCVCVCFVMCGWFGNMYTVL